MERSSPLATVRPPTLPGPWQRYDQTDCGNSGFLAPFSMNKNAFNARPARTQSSDYFTCRPVRESSPTSSLAIDLSQNFHIDQTPKLPTPRRSLFTANLFKTNITRVVLTPPEPSSSPGQDEHMMDVSPLPHKPAYTTASNIACSPTPEATPSIEQMRIEAPAISRTHSDEATTARQRKPLAPVRPFLRKGFSIANVPARPKSATATTFQFGPPLAALSKTALESFAESPPSQKDASRFVPPPRSSSILFGTSLLPQEGSPLNGSPLNNPRRAPSNGGIVQRGRYRRTQSMQANNVTKATRQEKRFCASGSFSISPPVCVEDTYKLKLPHFRNADEPEGLPRISKETFVEVLKGAYPADLGDYAIVDCRFEYEYEGGHIDGAVNYNDKELLAKQLFDDKLMCQKAIIFHCEYSAHRAPIMAKFIRQRDRTLNQDNYPRLTYPELYILDGGYSSFFKSHSERCFPPAYVEMSSTAHETACEAGMAKVKRRAKLSRAQTYAFGQSSTTLQAVAPLEKPSLPKMSFDLTTITASVTLDAMDVDMSSPFRMPGFDSPFRMPDIAEGHNKRHGLVLGASRRLDSF